MSKLKNIGNQVGSRIYMLCDMQSISSVIRRIGKKQGNGFTGHGAQEKKLQVCSINHKPAVSYENDTQISFIKNTHKCH